MGDESDVDVHLKDATISEKGEKTKKFLKKKMLDWKGVK